MGSFHSSRNLSVHRLEEDASGIETVLILGNEKIDFVDVWIGWQVPALIYALSEMTDR